MRETLAQRIEALMPHADVYRPSGQGPFPAVFQLHGCGGKKSFQKTWAETAVREGWAAIVLDSYAHRNISRLEAYATVCLGLRLWGRERAGDLFAGLAWARAQPWIDSERLVAAGWSHGGWTVLDALALQPGGDAAAATKLDDLPREPLQGLAGAFLVYPFAGPGAIAPARGLRYDARPLALVGSRDVIVGGATLRRTLQAIRTPRDPIAVEWMDGATHAFDEPDATDVRVRYDPELTRRAHALYARYLNATPRRRWL